MIGLKEMIDNTQRNLVNLYDFYKLYDETQSSRSDYQLSESSIISTSMKASSGVNSSASGSVLVYCGAREEKII